MEPQTFDQAVIEVLSEHLTALLVVGVPLFVSIFLKDAIANRIGGWWFKRKGYYHEDQYVKVDGQFGFIAYIGSYETKFYMYELNAGGEICGKWGMKILNNKLRDHKVEVLVPPAAIHRHPRGLYV